MGVTKSESFSKEAIQKAFKENGISFPLKDFLKSLRTETKASLVKKKVVKKKPKFNTLDIDKNNIFPAIKDDTTVEDFLSIVVDDGDFQDMFDDSDGLPDSGADETDYFKIGDKVYKAYLHCEAEWCGDWSLRKNLAGDVSVTKVKEIPYFKITKKNKYGITIQIPN